MMFGRPHGASLVHPDPSGESRFPKVGTGRTLLLREIGHRTDQARAAVRTPVSRATTLTTERPTLEATRPVFRAEDVSLGDVRIARLAD